MQNNSDKVSVSAVPFNPQTQSFNPAPVIPQVPNLSAVPTATQTDLNKFNQSMIVPQYNNTNPAIPIDSLNTQKANVPTPPVTQQQTPQINQAEQILQQTAVADTEAQKASQNLSKSILELIPSLQGQTQALSEAQAQVGLPAMRQNLQNINNQILTKQAELQQDDIRLAQGIQNIEDQPIAMEFITGQQASVQRNAQIARALKASEIGVLNATALGMQGNIALAEATAKQAVETKYAPYKEALDTYKLQLEAIQPLLTADEKKQSREQTIKTNLALKDLEDKKKQEDESRKMLIQATAQGLPQALQTKAEELIKKGATSSEVASTLGMYAGDYWGTKLKIAEYNKKMSEATGGTGTGVAGGLSASSPAESWLSQFNSGLLTADEIYTKIGSTKEGLRLKNEVAQLIAKQGGKRIIPMDDAQITAIDSQIKNIDDLIGKSGYNYKVISGAVQGGAFGFGGRATGAKDDALAIAENLISNQTLQSLADAKAKGITFGALSGPELNAVASAASRLASKAIRDKETGKITGFSGSESGLKADLDKIKEGLVLAKQKKTGDEPGKTSVDQKVEKAASIMQAPDTNSTAGYTFVDK